MFYTLDNVLIPDLYQIKKEFDLIDIIEWYTRLLLEHVTKPRHLRGLPLSLFVLKDMSGMKKRLRESRIPEIIDIISCLCDVACAVHLNIEMEGVHLCKPQQQKKSSFEGTFLHGQNKNKSNLLKLINNHTDLFPKLLCAKVKFGAVRRDLGLCEGNSKELKKMEKVMSEFEELGGEISKLANIIQEQILRRTKDQMNSIHNNLKTILCTCKLDSKHEIVENTLNSYWKGDISDNIYKYYSDIYKFPVIKSTTTFTNWGYLFHLQPTILHRKLRSDDEIEIIFLNSSYGRIFSSSNCKHILSSSYKVNEHGVIKEKQDVSVKCKLWLLARTVGFGWYRKYYIGKKRWGIFANPESLDLTP
ncbi:Hypothetical predicted protein [Mytilus galloprovincialis]|uniref:Uncharacterized protein n=1 Tax=Mytilus galloprovincialis TaxID=29158 RepID=A0A8B6ETX2_MYTGA|nr:Hypothetical predicted protein [Mytilus galloprovincialis]